MKLFELIKKSNTEYRVNFGDSIYAHGLCASVNLLKDGNIQVVVTYDTHWLLEMRFKHLSNVRKYFRLHGKYLLKDAEMIWHEVSYFKMDVCEKIYDYNKELLFTNPFYYEEIMERR